MGAFASDDCLCPECRPEDSTFTVGLDNEVDSFNPFLGIEAPSYEMWALTYDRLVNYDMETMAADSGPGGVLGDLTGRPHRGPSRSETTSCGRTVRS